jgi:hypothetical protein
MTGEKPGGLETQPLRRMRSMIDDMDATAFVGAGQRPAPVVLTRICLGEWLSGAKKVHPELTGCTFFDYHCRWGARES